MVLAGLAGFTYWRDNPGADGCAAAFVGAGAAGAGGTLTGVAIAGSAGGAAGATAAGAAAAAAAGAAAGTATGAAVAATGTAVAASAAGAAGAAGSVTAAGSVAAAAVASAGATRSSSISMATAAIAVGGGVGAASGPLALGVAIPLGIVGASTDNANVVVTWDCWKQIVDDTTTETSSGMALHHLLARPQVAQWAWCGNELQVTNVWAQVYAIKPVCSFGRHWAFHAENMDDS